MSDAMKSQACPKCGHVLDSAVSTTDKSRRVSPGGLTVCFYCSAILRFDNDMNLRRMTPEDMGELPILVRLQLARVVVAVRKKAMAQ